MRQIRVLHVITGLGQGGAERQLTNLVRACNGYPASAVFSICKPGKMGQQVRDAGVPVFSGEAAGAFSAQWPLALRRTVRSWRPDLVVGWMYHGNLAASFCPGLGYKGPVVWNVRHSIQDLSQEEISTRAVVRAGAWLSGGPARIIYNSEIAALQHEAIGYRSERRTVVANGFDLERFQPNPQARSNLRRSLGVGDQELLLGVIGRSHPMKNHVGWVSAFAQLVAKGAPVRCIMVGTGVDDPAGPVATAVRSEGLSDRIGLFPGRDDPEAIYPALDLLVMPSVFGEGFPNVVGEAMACGVPALVTDVGDSARVVGSTGFIVEGSDPRALGEAAWEAVRFGGGALAEIGLLARERIMSRFELTKIARAYYDILADVVDG